MAWLHFNLPAEPSCLRPPQRRRVRPARAPRRGPPRESRAAREAAPSPRTVGALSPRAPDGVTPPFLLCSLLDTDSSWPAAFRALGRSAA
ncbi:unnamed protein product [Boreogadus saida]